MPVPRHLRLRIFPTSDRAFAAEVRDALSTHAAMSHDDEQLRAAAIGALRPGYRSIAIVVQDDVARMDPDTRTWYIYRDGKLRLGNAERERVCESH